MQQRSVYFLLLVLALAGLSGWGFTQKRFNYGLDVEGGVRLTYLLDLKDMKGGTTPAQVQKQVIDVMERRAVGMTGVVEPNIIAKGEDQIIIELPGNISLETARAVMGSTASLKWYHAKNIATEDASYREYSYINNKDGDVPEVSFQRARGSGDVIKPGTPAYAAVIAGWGQPILEGTDLADAVPQASGTGYQPLFTFSAEGGRKMETWSRAFFGKGECLAAVLDGVCISLSPVKKDAQLSTNAYIDGQFSAEYVNSLTNMLKSGALPVSLKEISSLKVDPTIGRFALNQIVTWGVIAFIAITIFVIAYYAFPGLVALVALLLYCLFSLTVLKALGATFSLAAIAGFVLSVGMAVDANILVFERFKEEIQGGRTLNQAIELGFKRAFPAILDSNACTIITSLVLSAYGTGPVKGFATTLIIGVAISLFTAVTVTRSLLVFLVNNGIGKNESWYAVHRSWFGQRVEKEADTNPIRVIEKSKLYFLISFVTIIPGVIFLLMGGMKPNVEFMGGFEATFSVANDAEGKTMLDALTKAGGKGINMKFAEGQGTDGKTVRLALFTIPREGAFKIEDPKVAEPEILKTVGRTSSQGFQAISGSVRDETVRNAIMGIIVSSVVIVIYLALRFGFALGGFIIGLRFALSVIAALIHDILLVVGMAALCGALFGWEVSALFISAMLTVIGFSTHDTIVIFDRIRENLRHPLPNEDLANLVNRSITRSFSRSINTSFTVVLTLLLLIIGGSATPDLKLFNATMLVGIISGTYSSIFNAAPILYFWDRWVQKRNEESSMLAIARASAGRVRLTRQSAAPAAAAEAPSGQSYGQTKRRRASQIEQNIDEP